MAFVTNVDKRSDCTSLTFDLHYLLCSSTTDTRHSSQLGLFRTYIQGCGITMPDLSDSGLFVCGQVDFAKALFRGQVNLEKYNIMIFNFACNVWQETLYLPGSRPLTRPRGPIFHSFCDRPWVTWLVFRRSHELFVNHSDW